MFRRLPLILLIVAVASLGALALVAAHDHLRSLPVVITFSDDGKGTLAGHTAVIKKVNYGLNFWTKDKEFRGELKSDGKGRVKVEIMVNPGRYAVSLGREGWRCEVGEITAVRDSFIGVIIAESPTLAMCALPTAK